MAQKLAYLYGWPDLLENGEVDEQTELELTLLFGTMAGVAAAEKGLAEIAPALRRTGHSPAASASTN